ncbi:MAG TPA: L-threonylcarbamoyladenylate synthase [Phycisphaerae bacterium]|nr:L-threonylcarbamoyladenylate synthase [Phycisphaerae bacterium]
MDTRIADPGQVLSEAASLLAAGELVAFPTETVYGLGADATNPAAVARIFQIKGRPSENPLIVHVADARGARRWVREFPIIAEVLAEKFWPGPLTLVLPRAVRICPAVAAGLDSVAIRVPAHPAALALLAAVDRPIAAPSANRSGRVSPTTARHVLDEFNGMIPLILDGGPCQVGVESTVLDLTVGKPVILRPGGVTPSMLESALSSAGLPVQLSFAPGDSSSVDKKFKSPGLMERHYAPRTPAYRFRVDQIRRVTNWLQQFDHRSSVVLLRFADCPNSIIVKSVEMLPDDPVACARNLYSMLRRLDHQDHDAILIQMPTQTGDLWAAIADRLMRATKELP